MIFHFVVHSNDFKAMYDEAKDIDNRLPFWPKLAALSSEGKPAATSPGGLRELARDGSVTDSELEARGFASGCKVVQKKGDACIFTLAALAKHISLQADAEEGGEATKIDINRVEFLSNWKLHQVEEHEIFEFG